MVSTADQYAVVDAAGDCGELLCGEQKSQNEVKGATERRDEERYRCRLPETAAGLTEETSVAIAQQIEWVPIDLPTGSVMTSYVCQGEGVPVLLRCLGLIVRRWSFGGWCLCWQTLAGCMRWIWLGLGFAIAQF